MDDVLSRRLRARASVEVVQRADLRASVLTAIRWTVLSKLLGQLASWAVTLYVIRILSPDDYGVMAMASVPIAFFYLLNTAGLDAVLVQKKDVPAPARAQIFGVVIVLNLILYLAFLGSAPRIAAFYHEPRLTLIIRVLAFQFVLLIFETLPQAQLERDLNFGPRSIVELVTLIAGGLTALALARAGFGVWTLVWGSLVTIAIRMLGLNLVQHALCWPSFSLKGLKEDLRFGRSATVDRIMRFTLADTDRPIGGKIFGDTLLGYYAVANDLAVLPIHRLTGLMNSIALPAFSKARANPRAAGAALLTVCRVMSLLVFPFFLGLSSIAAEVTALLLGSKWHAVAVPLQLLSIVMPLRMLMNTLQPFLWGIGMPGRSVSMFLIGALSMPAAFLVGAYWGPAGLSMAWVLVYPCIFLLSVAHIRGLEGVRVTDILHSIRSPAVAGLLMYGAVVAAKSLLVGGPGAGAVHLLELVLVGGAVYIGSMLILDRGGVREAAELLKIVVGRSPDTTARA